MEAFRSEFMQNLMVYATAISGILLPACVYILYKWTFNYYRKCFASSPLLKRKNSDPLLSEPKISNGVVKPLGAPSARLRNVEIKIYFSSQTGNAKHFASQLFRSFDPSLNIEIQNLKSVDPDNFLTFKGVCLFLVSTYEEGRSADDTQWFFDWLQDVSSDFRIHSSTLSQMQFAIFGLGSSYYTRNFNKVAKSLRQSLMKLEAKPLVNTRLADENNQESDLESQFLEWSSDVIQAVFTAFSGTKSNMAAETMSLKYETESESEDMVGDIEEAVVSEKRSSNANGYAQNCLPEMVTPMLRSSLTKQGYKLIGSHSGVKLCRWTKSMLRGRGGCYKHSFYGIASHRCMEATPSLACANKCVFCWRHHSNPVGTEWRWRMDDPEMIVREALQNHWNMIKQCKGVPGIKPERFIEGKTPKHCALSLVGEPIMYPKINALVRLLHRKDISTFLVTNAQFPDAIRSLIPVTQLYVSVDASTKESLKKIDRPLFRDFWDRFLDSMDALSEKGQRTVYRLTLVKAWNTEEMKGYADLIKRGNPDFVEVKGVTYCGESKASSLTMENVPWHEEVCSFVESLVGLLEDYEIAAEHEHSNCLLVANKKFKRDSVWHTWIDYDKFHSLMQQYEETGQTFTSLDYVAKTPEWALYGSKERGFDPEEVRWYRKNRKDISGC